MTGARWHWAQRAQELRLHQLDAAHRQAESWRTGLAGVTTLVGAVLIVGGRDTVAGLAPPYPQIAVALLGLAVGAFVAATFAAVRAAAGAPGDECLLTGEDLEAWTNHEVVVARRAIGTAQLLTLSGAGLLAAALGLSWLAPEQDVSPMVIVSSAGTSSCGVLVGIDTSTVRLRIGGHDRLIPLTPTTQVEPTDRCAD
jgi:hypothetical protein